MAPAEVAYRPLFIRSAYLVSRLSRTEALCAEIAAGASGMPWVSRARRDALVRHAHYSSRIEGNPLTLPEVEALAEGRSIRADDHARREILGYFAALRWIWDKGARKGISERGLLAVHGLLTRGLLHPRDSGHYKTVQNAVFSGRKVVYRPPPPEAAPILTAALIGWVNSAAGRAEHPVVTAAVAHHRLVSIHPVLDGNGRLARLLEAWILYARGFDTLHIFALPEFYEHDRRRYYAEIERVRHAGGDLSRWLDYVAEGVVAVLERTRARFLAGGYGTVEAPRLSPKQHAVLNMLAGGRPLTGPDLCRALGIGRAMLSRIMQPLLAAGLVTREGRTKGALYRLPPPAPRSKGAPRR